MAKLTLYLDLDGVMADFDAHFPATFDLNHRELAGYPDGGCMSTKLRRVRQCQKCPWKVSTDPHDIPHGYSEDLHRGLSRTIAEPGSFRSTNSVMACHEHPPGDEVYCVGWLMHQLGTGHNIPLRLAMMRCENIGDVRLDGPQHERFEDTLPCHRTDQGAPLPAPNAED